MSARAALSRGKTPAASGAAEKAARLVKGDIGYDELRASFSREEQQAYLDSVRGRAA